MVSRPRREATLKRKVYEDEGEGEGEGEEEEEEEEEEEGCSADPRPRKDGGTPRWDECFPR
jgi:hypothetical protein